jgi:hypothetical protein
METPMLDWAKNRYLDAIDLIDDHPHATFWVILSLAALVVVF